MTTTAPPTIHLEVTPDEMRLIRGALAIAENAGTPWSTFNKPEIAALYNLLTTINA